MTVSTIKGKKGPEDQIIHYNNKPITLVELAKILLILWENEDKIYPPPKFKGSKMSVDFLMEVYKTRKITDELLQKYHLTK